MEIHYTAINIYQYSYVKPLYREIGGDFIVHKPRAWIHLVKNFRGFDSQHPSRGLLGTQPKTRFHSFRKYDSLSGLLVSTIQFQFSRNPDRLTTINIGHGTGYKPARKKDPWGFDYYLIEGDMRLEYMRNTERLEMDDAQIIKTGNLRFDDVINGRLDREQILKDFGVKDVTRPNIVFAPTWGWGRGTLLANAQKLIEELSPEYNLFIRPHYYDWRNMGPIRKFVKAGDYDHVYLVEPWNIRTKDTMENLCIANLLISDNSSIAYQSLIFQIPIVLVVADHDQLLLKPAELDLNKVVDHWDERTPIKPIVEENLRTNKYRDDLKNMLDNCFYHNDGKATQRAVDFLKSIST
ncbi:MAG: CDP-glycerol glycerophosphotransferase family protein [Candidatus Neomarinimicrobiota bacterium]